MSGKLRERFPEQKNSSKQEILRIHPQFNLGGDSCEVQSSTPGKPRKVPFFVGNESRVKLMAKIHSNWFSPGQPLIPHRFLLPSRELTYPTKREVRKIIDSKVPFLEDMLVPWRVSQILYLRGTFCCLVIFHSTPWVARSHS